MIKASNNPVNNRVNKSVKAILNDRTKLCEAVYLHGSVSSFARSIGVSTPTIAYYFKKHGIDGSNDAKMIGSLSAGRSATDSGVIHNNTSNGTRGSAYDYASVGSWLPALIVGLCMGVIVSYVFMVVVK